MPKFSFGWIKDKADHRDYTTSHPLFKCAAPRLQAPPSVDLRKLDTPIFDQGQLGSCTANAGAGLLQFMEKNSNPAGSFTPASRLDLYYTTRHGARRTGDTGAELRETLQAIAMRGVAPEVDWPYNINNLDVKPNLQTPGTDGDPEIVRADASKYVATKYFKLDPDGADKTKVLADIKTCLFSNMPVIFGTLVYGQIEGVGKLGDITNPGPQEQPIGGHALMIVGYDDDHQIQGANKGAFLLRNSWGTSWGMDGYAYLPYDYLLNGQASDFWTVQRAEWVDCGAFA